MDLTSYVDGLRRELAVAARAGGDDAHELAERLVAPLESAARLILLEALSAAADEITRDLAPGSVEVRLRGRDPDFVVTRPPAGPPPAEPPMSGTTSTFADPTNTTTGVRPPAPPPPPPPFPPLPPPPPLDPEEGGGTSRITLRLPEHLKPRIEEAAAQAGLSVNAWLVRAVSAALEPRGPGRSGPRSATSGPAT